MSEDVRYQLYLDDLKVYGSSLEFISPQGYTCKMRRMLIGCWTGSIIVKNDGNIANINGINIERNVTNFNDGDGNIIFYFDCGHMTDYIPGDQVIADKNNILIPKGKIYRDGAYVKQKLLELSAQIKLK